MILSKNASKSFMFYVQNFQIFFFLFILQQCIINNYITTHTSTIRKDFHKDKEKRLILVSLLLKPPLPTTVPNHLC